MNKKIKTDLLTYLAGGKKLKDVMAEHDLTRTQTGKMIDEIIKEPLIFPPKRNFKIKIKNVDELVRNQLQREKQMRVTEEISQNLTVPGDWYKHSRLINSTRIYGNE